ncbi:MAG: nuclear transport factor 2 family protein [Caulobacter sp.]|nr:nuclear transport factor 2 family protein [Caulobacter sp.]
MDAAQDLVHRFLDALDRRDLDAVASLIHPQGRFRDYLNRGEVTGPEGIRDFHRRLFESLDVQIDKILVETMADGRVHAILQVAVRDQAGHLWSDTRVHVIYEVADGLILSQTLDAKD